ncbi:MAG TPA: hypothetical protein VGL83_08045 [Stellaceae bacterium]|jgi:hypothetical protein
MVESRRRRRDARGDGSAVDAAGQAGHGAETTAASGARGAAIAPGGGTLSGGAVAPDTLAGEAEGLPGSGALTEILGRADKVFAAPASATSSSAAPAAIAPLEAQSLPGVCMGVSGLCSLSLYKLRLRELDSHEAEALTNAMLRNLEAWDITIEDPKMAAAADLIGCASGIIMIRVVEKLRELEAVRARSPVQAATAARAEKSAQDPAPEKMDTPPAPAKDGHVPEHDGAGITAALTGGA